MTEPFPCQMCGSPDVPPDPPHRYRGTSETRLCVQCIERVLAGGPWRTRRPQAAAARRDALITKFPELTTVKDTPAVLQLRGHVDGLLVEIRLRIKVREYTNERYIFHVEYPAPAPLPTAAELGLPAHIADLVQWDSPKITQSEVRWLRVAFRHLGKWDTVTALECLLQVVRRQNESPRATS
ncbi:hypothetical protein ACWDOP_26965 [Nocardia sp. NPDC003693]